MKKIENDCVGCPPEMGCLGDTCPYRNATHFYCDNCGEEADLYYFDDEELCIDCIQEKLKKVEG